MPKRGRTSTGSTTSSLTGTVEAAERALDAIVSRVSGLVHFPNTGRRIEQDGQTFRELLIPFGGTGYLALYQLAKDGDVQILAIRHQREDDYR